MEKKILHLGFKVWRVGGDLVSRFIMGITGVIM